MLVFQAFGQEQRYTLLGFISLSIWAFSAFFALKLCHLPVALQSFFLFSCGFIVARLLNYFLKPSACFFDFSLFHALALSLILFLNQQSYLRAFQLAPAAQVDLINYSWPALAGLLHLFFSKEAPCRKFLTSLPISMLGIYFAFLPLLQANSFCFDHFSGYCFSFLAAATWALYSVYLKVFKEKIGQNGVIFSYLLPCVFSFWQCDFSQAYQDLQLTDIFWLFICGSAQIGLAYPIWERAMAKGNLKILSLNAFFIPFFSIFILLSFSLISFHPALLLSCFCLSLAALLPTAQFFLSHTKSTALSSGRP